MRDAAATGLGEDAGAGGAASRGRDGGDPSDLELDEGSDLQGSTRSASESRNTKGKRETGSGGLQEEQRREDSPDPGGMRLKRSGPGHLRGS